MHPRSKDRTGNSKVLADARKARKDRKPTSEVGEETHSQPRKGFRARRKPTGKQEQQ